MLSFDTLLYFWEFFSQFRRPKETVTMKIPEIYCLKHVCSTCICIRRKKTEKVLAKTLWQDFCQGIHLSDIIVAYTYDGLAFGVAVLCLIIYMYILKEIVYLTSTLKTKAFKTQLSNDFTSKSISINETARVKIAPEGTKMISASCKYVPQELTKWW